MVLATTIVDKDRVRNDRGSRDAIVQLNDGFDAVCSEYFQSRYLGRSREGMCVFAHKEWPIGTLHAPIIADGLGNGQDVRFGKCPAQRRAAVAAGSEAYHLGRIT